jgi:hypothetical protein
MNVQALIIDQMSIRRKTCETTSLLYEAALKTNLTELEDGQSARPSNVNPTAGVRMREKFGNSVFIPDSTKPGGGIWVAQSKDEMLNAGLPQGDQVLEADYKGVNGGQDRVVQVQSIGNGFNANNNITPTPPRTGHGDVNELTGSQDILQNMQMSTTNVNPNINTDMGLPIPDPTQAPGLGPGQQVLPGQEVFILFLVTKGSKADIQLFMDSGNGVGFDASLLEGLPLNQFNWNEWNVS